MRVIWAYHHEDVGDAGPKYHDSSRGTKSLRLLNPEKTSVSFTAVPSFDLVNQDVSFFRFYDRRGGCMESMQEFLLTLLRLTVCQENVTLCPPPLFIKTGPHPKQRDDLLVPNV